MFEAFSFFTDEQTPYAHKHAYLRLMKTRLNITIEEDLLNSAKRYAAKKDISLSQLVELYFKNITRASRKESVIQLIEQLPKPKIDLPNNLKEGYYKEQKEKYGF